MNDFSTQNNTLHLALKVLGSSSEPIGAGALAHTLGKMGYPVSMATAGRIRNQAGEGDLHGDLHGSYGDFLLSYRQFDYLVPFGVMNFPPGPLCPGLGKPLLMKAIRTLEAILLRFDKYELLS